MKNILIQQATTTYGAGHLKGRSLVGPSREETAAPHHQQPHSQPVGEHGCPLRGQGTSVLGSTSALATVLPGSRENTSPLRSTRTPEPWRPWVGGGQKVWGEGFLEEKPPHSHSWGAATHSFSCSQPCWGHVDRRGTKPALHKLLKHRPAPAKDKDGSKRWGNREGKDLLCGCVEGKKTASLPHGMEGWETLQKQGRQEFLLGLGGQRSTPELSHPNAVVLFP